MLELIINIILQIFSGYKIQISLLISEHDFVTICKFHKVGHLYKRYSCFAKVACHAYPCLLTICCITAFYDVTRHDYASSFILTLLVCNLNCMHFEMFVSSY
jgi:hypothetical protein